MLSATVPGRILEPVPAGPRCGLLYGFVSTLVPTGLRLMLTGHDDLPVHPDDPQMAAEHEALLDLVPLGTETHRAIASGDWFDSATWSGGAVPGEGAIVLIPAGVSVVYVGEASAALLAVRVDGALEFAAPGGTATAMTVDTIVATPGARLAVEAGAATDGTVEIVIAPFDIEDWAAGGSPGWNDAARAHFVDGADVHDHFGGAIDDGAGVLGRFRSDGHGGFEGWDPRQLSLGIVGHGITDIRGQEKTSFVGLRGDAHASDTTLELRDVPEGWRVGDRILVTATTFRSDAAAGEATTYDEVRTITAIDGSLVTFDLPLDHDHLGHVAEDLFGYAANLTRNVTIRSAEAEATTSRGHTMFMHSPRVTIENAAFVDLGRTDKSNLVDDFAFDLVTRKGELRIANVDGSPAAADEIENMRGRYSLHVHRTGTEDGAEQAVARGNVVWGSPGWGMVHHDSDALFEANTVFGATGAGMVAESGSETGAWIGNLVAGSVPARNEDGAIASDAIPGGITAGLLRTSRSLFDDDFRGGAAFGFQSRVVATRDNVAVSSDVGFQFSGSTDFEPFKGYPSPHALPVDAFPLHDRIEPDAPALVQFEGNEVVGSRHAFTSQGRMEAGDTQLQSVVADFDAWNIAERGFYMASNFGYLFKDIRLIGDGSGLAVLLLHDDDDIHFVDMRVSGMHVGVSGGGSTAPGEGRNHPDGQFVFLDVDFDGIADPFGDFFPGAIVRTRGELSDTAFSFAPNDNLDTTIDIGAGDWRVVVDGTITDAVGAYGFGHLDKTGGPNDRRTYDFQGRLEGYLHRYGLTRDGDNASTSLTEYMAERITGVVHAVVFEIDIEGLDPSFVGAGDDALRAGPGGGTLRGGAGRDVLQGGAGEDLLDGGPGDDTVTGDLGRDRVEGGAGERDLFDLGGIAADRGLNVDLNEGRFRLQDGWGTIGGIEDIAGSAGVDVMVGNQRANRLSGNGGHDQLRGLDGDDQLGGGGGDDRLAGGNGADSLTGGSGNDVLDGGTGRDVISGGGGDDRLMGGTGRDWLDGGARADTLDGGVDGDTLTGGSGADLFLFPSRANFGDAITDFSAVSGDRIVLAVEGTASTSPVDGGLALFLDDEIVVTLVGVSVLPDEALLRE